MKLIFLTLLSVSIVGCSGGRNSTGYSIISDMMYAVPYEAFSENPVFKNRQTNQQPVAGTIARGQFVHPIGDNGKPLMLENPFEMDDYGWYRGQMLYESMCSSCHGVKGKANGLVVIEGGYPKPPSFSARKWKKVEKYPSGHVYNVITFGYGNMSSYAEQLSPEDRWHVSEYVRQKLMRKRKKRR